MKIVYSQVRFEFFACDLVVLNCNNCARMNYPFCDPLKFCKLFLNLQESDFHGYFVQWCDNFAMFKSLKICDITKLLVHVVALANLMSMLLMDSFRFYYIYKFTFRAFFYKNEMWKQWMSVIHRKNKYYIDFIPLFFVVWIWK